MHTAQETRELILTLLKSKKITTSKMLTDIECNQSLIHDMNRKNAMPSADKIAKIADYLDISVDYLLGITNDSAKKEYSAFSESEINLLSKICSLDEDKKRAVTDFINAMVD